MSHWRMWVALAFVVLLALGALVIWVVPHDSSAAPEPDPDGAGCNGRVELCDRTLDQVALAGSHNAMSVRGEPGWYLGFQRRTISDQLEAGVRALLIDVYPGYRDGDLVRTDLRQPIVAAAAASDVTPAGRSILGRLGVSVGAVPPEDADIRPYLCHAYCELGASDLVEQLGHVADFVTSNPNDVVLLIVQDYISGEETQLAFEQAGLMGHVWPLTSEDPMPTLRDMVTMRKNVVVLSENHGGEVPWMPAAYDVMEETPYEFKTPADFTCAPNRGGSGKPLFLLNHFLDYRGRPAPWKARPVNARAVLEQRLDQCRAERGRVPGIIAVDFTDTGAVVRVVARLNRGAGLE
jgi:hypothetical protein